MQGNDFAQSVRYHRGITCASCHDVHGTDNYAQLRKPSNQIVWIADRRWCRGRLCMRIPSRFISPAMTDKDKIPNPCTSCHADKSTASATRAMRGSAKSLPWMK